MKYLAVLLILSGSGAFAECPDTKYVTIYLNNDYIGKCFDNNKYPYGEYQLRITGISENGYDYEYLDKLCDLFDPSKCFTSGFSKGWIIGNRLEDLMIMGDPYKCRRVK